MSEIVLNDAVIEKVKEEAADMIKAAMGKDLVKIVLYGSCARGDYNQDSDIDIALIMACDRLEAKKYNEKIAEISMQLAMKYFSVVNFVCLPYAEFAKKKSWYSYFRNIDSEGEVLYVSFLRNGKGHKSSFGSSGGRGDNTQWGIKTV